MKGPDIDVTLNQKTREDDQFSPNLLTESPSVAPSAATSTTSSPSTSSTSLSLTEDSNGAPAFLIAVTFCLMLLQSSSVRAVSRDSRKDNPSNLIITVMLLENPVSNIIDQGAEPLSAP
ncbi:hypothetical protein BYT27DRAFT_7249847 [Phlegmacium glaucopus]|nr:hypothetical protein BYT27DRAFT_7249847 [Phlegmacium glaucopus]